MLFQMMNETILDPILGCVPNGMNFAGSQTYLSYNGVVHANGCKIQQADEFGTLFICPFASCKNIQLGEEYFNNVCDGAYLVNAYLVFELRLDGDIILINHNLVRICVRNHEQVSVRWIIDILIMTYYLSFIQVFLLLPNVRQKKKNNK